MSNLQPCVYDPQDVFASNVLMIVGCAATGMAISWFNRCLFEEDKDNHILKLQNMIYDLELDNQALRKKLLDEMDSHISESTEDEEEEEEEETTSSKEEKTD